MKSNAPRYTLYFVGEATIQEQLKAQGYELSANDATLFQRDVDNVNRLRSRGVLSRSASDAALIKVRNSIDKVVRLVSLESAIAATKEQP